MQLPVTRLTSKILVLCVVWFPSAGCTLYTSSMSERIEIPAATPARNQLDLTPLGLALNRVVSEERLRPRALLEARPLLDTFLAQAAAIGPSTTPDAFATRDARLAYALNCRIACLLCSLIEISTPQAVPEKAPSDFERRFSFRVDGVWRTPADLAAMARGEAGDDWRIIFALATVTGDGPAIPARPWLPDLLDAQLNHATRDALMSPRVARLDYGEIKQILFWRDLWEIRRDLIADYESRTGATDARMLNVLLEWAASSFDRITLNSAVGYIERPMPSDRTIPWTGMLVAE